MIIAQVPSGYIVKLTLIDPLYEVLDHQTSGVRVRFASPIVKHVHTSSGEDIEFASSSRGFIISASAEVEDVVGVK